ncbi:hypothetical protein FHW58_004856 [Duganella sp. 1224]|uniref:hypothetical protein n=1 Tax=Duganella sp. 1224 TaxID=2587052 RepID=UPI0015CB6995|nr:hypothetical protein [Duganella sp. 1224]NYE63625.1 hypothetical protein [Duganella sp. 1224]
MKKNIIRQLIVLPLLAAVMAMLYACGAASSRVPPAPAPFTATYVLRQGASATIGAAAVQHNAGVAAAAPVVRLERVNDSRCRADAVCVWAGYISFSFALLQQDGTASNFVLSDNMPNGTPSISRDGLTFTLAGFEPQQVPAKNEAAPDYQVSLKVSNINPP